MDQGRCEQLAGAREHAVSLRVALARLDSVHRRGSQEPAEFRPQSAARHDAPMRHRPAEVAAGKDGGHGGCGNEAARGKSVVHVVREVPKEGVRDVVATVAVAERVAAGESGAAAAAYFCLARAREAEALDAMIQANTLMLESPSGAAVRE